MTPPTDRVPGPPRRVHGSRPPGPARQAGDVQPPALAQQARGPHPPGPAHEARGPHLFRSAERVRGYHLVGPAGQDGPWTLYRARSVATMADVLVKTLACHRVGKRALKRIIRGFAFPGELAAHPGVIPVLEVGATGDGRPYLVTPPHDGLTLAERPDRDRPLPVEQVAGLLAAVARAVAATHAAGGVHGRVTPSNVVMTPNGVMLTGFAMSALMSIAELPDGTPPSVHASPEELEGRPPSPASDVYTLASTTYELLTGHPAFPLEDATNTARFTLAVLTEPPPPLPPTVPEPLATLLAQALSKDPATRPTATTLAATAHRFASGPPRPHTTGAPAAGKGATAPDVQQAAPAGSAADQRFGVDGSGPSSVAPPPFGGTAASSAGLTSGSVPGAAADQPRTARLPEPGPQLPRTARLPASGSPGNQELSGPRELVWTVDSERSRVRPPAGPQPFLPTPPEPGSSAQAPDGQAPAAQAPAAAEGGRRGRTPLVVAGVSALAVLAGAGSVALAMSGDRGATQTADHQAAATQPPDTGVRDGQPGEGDTQNSPHDGQPQDGQVQDGRPQPLRPDARATGDRSQPEPSPAPEQSTAGPATSPPATLRTPGPATLTAYRPKSLKLVADNGTTVTLSWKTARRTEYPVIVQQAPDDRLMSAPVGSTTYTVGKLDPGTGYCFKVGAVVALGRPSSVAWSSALCIRGAAETGAEDDVQPPIVLPLVTPPTG